MSITNEHIAFARAVVALAREHKMDSIDITFRPGFYSPVKYPDNVRVRVCWSSGRHGDKSNMTFSFEESKSVPETGDPA